MEKYLDEAKAKRYLELLNHGDIHGFVETADRKEFRALSEESLAKQIEIYGEPTHTPFEGKCRRCGIEFGNPVPEVTNPEGRNKEIACVEWCPRCNKVAMAALYRGASAYYEYGLRPPWQSEGEAVLPKGGKKYAG